MEYLTSGMTAAFDMYPWPEEMARACVESGFRTVLVSGLNDFVSSPEGLEEDYLKFNSYDPLVSYQLGFSCRVYHQPEDSGGGSRPGSQV